VQHLTKKIKTFRTHAPVAAGATDVTDSIVVDMQNYEAVRFIVGFGAITNGAATSVKVQEADAKSSATALTSGADLLGSGITVLDTDDNSLVISDIMRPRKRYVQVHILRATQNAVVDLVIAELYGARKLPVTQDATVTHDEEHTSPAEGTA
jgi:O-glycosyl hydrolase